VPTLLPRGTAPENDPEGLGVPRSLRLEDRPGSMLAQNPFCCNGGSGWPPWGRGVVCGLSEGDLWCMGGVTLLHRKGFLGGKGQAGRLGFLV